MTTTNNPLVGNIRGKDSGNWEGGHAAETSRETVIRHILSEREHQIAKWGNPQHDHAWWYVIMGEEVGEVANALQEVEDQKSADIAEQLQAMFAEIVQVAAVATAWGEQVLRLLMQEGMLPGERNEFTSADGATSDGRFRFGFDVDPDDHELDDDEDESPAQLMVSVPSPVVRGVWRVIKYISVDELAEALDAAGLLPNKVAPNEDKKG